MPAGDRTGPWGQGPRTGRALGYCEGFDTPGYTRPTGGGMGMGRGFGFRGGWGIGRRYYGRGGRWAPEYYRYNIPPFQWHYGSSGEDELKLLKAEAERLRKYQKDIEKRISDLEKESPTKKS
jgi:hypothetical protein